MSDPTTQIVSAKVLTPLARRIEAVAAAAKTAPGYRADVSKSDVIRWCLEGALPQIEAHFGIGEQK